MSACGWSDYRSTITPPRGLPRNVACGAVLVVAPLSGMSSSAVTLTKAEVNRSLRRGKRRDGREMPRGERVIRGDRVRSTGGSWKEP